MPKPGKKKGSKSEAPKELQPSEPSEVPEQVEVEEEEGLGLGLGSRRKQRKDKKQAKQESTRQAVAVLAERTPAREKSETTPVSEVSESTPDREKSEQPVDAPKPKVEAKVEEATEELEGLGLGSAKKKRPKKKKGDAATSASQQVVTPAAQVSPAAAASAGDHQILSPSGPHQAPPTFVSPSQPRTLVPPSTSFPPPGFSPRSAPSQPSGTPTSPWGKQPTSPPQFPVSQSTPHFMQPGVPTSPPQPTSPQPSTSLHSSASSISRVKPSRPGQYSQENVLCRYKIPLKIPGRMVNARNIAVLTNYLEMTFKPLKISRYDVTFIPDKPKRLIPLVFKKVKEKIYPNELLAFDQTKNCYSLRPLPNVVPHERFNTSVEIADANGKVIRFEVSFKATGIVELEKIKRYMSERGASVLHPTEEVQCIDVILRQGTLESYVKAGRQFFKRPAQPIDLGHGYEMWTGLFQSAIFTSKAFINIDVAHKGFPKHQKMIDAITRDFNLSINAPVERQRPIDVELFMSFIKGLKVVAEMVGDTPTRGQTREFICNGLLDPPHKLEFQLNLPGGKTRTITVGKYYAEKGYQIKHPQFNCIWVGPKEKTIYFPVELLEVAYGQPLARQLNETQVAKMVREAATPPDKRLQKITEVISSMQYSRNADFKKFGLEISDKFYEVKAKVLEPPTLDIGRGTAVPRQGQWQANQLLKPESLLSWGFIAIESSPSNDYEGVIRTLMSAGKQMGMNISNPFIKRFDVQLTSLSNVLRWALDQNIKFMFVVVSTRGRDHYHRVKQMAEREVGMLTQCVKEATVRKMNMMTAKNILLKVNSKLMGINQALGERTLPRCLKGGGVMIVGADVTHPSPDQANVPSIAAVTASIDRQCYVYNIELSIQTPKKEMIVEFEDMMFDHLKVYKERNMDQLPKKIFVFRDGVSEGQFVQVMNGELAAVHAAYARLAGATRKPEILFLLVQKRHHTRFFNKGANSNYNVEPGTVVDTDIVHSSELDFYLVSHHALKGTARPTRYHAVCNDGRIPDDEVEQLTFYLCHLYSRCTRSVSYPTPTYYAHLACLRARSLTFGQKFSNKELETKPERLHVLKKMLEFSRMFFV